MLVEMLAIILYKMLLIDTFPNAKLIVIRVGFGYVFDRTKHRLGGVLVSRKISDLKNLKFDSRGEVVNRGQIVDVVNTLTLVFCKSLKFERVQAGFFKGMSHLQSTCRNIGFICRAHGQ